MSIKAVVESSMVHFRRALSVGRVARAAGWRAAARAGPAEGLISAALRGDAAAVQALLAKGADVNAKGGYGRTALDAATAGGHAADVIALLVQAGAKP